MGAPTEADATARAEKRRPGESYAACVRELNRGSARGRSLHLYRRLTDEPLYQIDHQKQDHRPQGRRDNRADNASAQG